MFFANFLNFFKPLPAARRGMRASRTDAMTAPAAGRKADSTAGEARNPYTAAPRPANSSMKSRSCPSPGPRPKAKSEKPASRLNRMSSATVAAAARSFSRKALRKS